MDLLEPLPNDHWPLLQQQYQKNWPFYAQYYYWINNAIKWKKIDPECLINIFCPRGKYDSGIFIGILTVTANNSFNEEEKLLVLTISTFENSKNLLRQILMETKVIDWRSNIYILNIHQCTKDILTTTLNELQGCKKFKIARTVETTAFFKPKEECLKLNIKIPEECELRPLDKSHIPLVHSYWHKSKENLELTKKYLEITVAYNRGIGLFLKENNSLISWILHRDFGGLGMLETVEEHQRKGYARVLVKAIAKQLAEEENLDSTTFIIEGNVPSYKLFMSLGYENITPSSFILIEPING